MWIVLVVCATVRLNLIFVLGIDNHNVKVKLLKWCLFFLTYPRCLLSVVCSLKLIRMRQTKVEKLHKFWVRLVGTPFELTFRKIDFFIHPLYIRCEANGGCVVKQIK
jgi:hypothetical protein